MTREEILAALMTVLDEEHARAVVDHRKSKKCALTVFAARLLAKQFSLCPDPNAAAEEMILRGWQGFKAEWLARPVTRQRAGRRNFTDVAMDRLNGSASLSRIDADARLLPADQRQPGLDGECLRAGCVGPLFASRH